MFNVENMFQSIANGDVLRISLALHAGHIHKGNMNRRFDRGQTLLKYAVRHKNGEVARMLLEYGAKPGIPDECEETPLVTAVLNLDFALVELLLAHGAEIDVTNIEGQTALLILTSMPDKNLMDKQLKMIRLLIEHGADPSIKDNYTNRCNNYLHLWPDRQEIVEALYVKTGVLV